MKASKNIKSKKTPPKREAKSAAILQSQTKLRSEPKSRVRTTSKAPVRLSDVAKLAGVSSGTVSRVINQPEMVSPEATKAIRSAIDKLGWVPHGAARALASHKSHTIGAIIPNLANPVFAQMIYAIQHRLVAAGYILMIGCSEYDQEKGLLEARAMIERGIDGLILLGENFPDTLWTLLEVQKIPYLVIYSFRHGGERKYVGFDNDRAARQSANYLLDLGHTRFAILGQDTAGNDRATARLRGFLGALADRNIEVSPQNIIQKPWSILAGHQAFRQILESKDFPSAVLCSNDYLATGALAACHEHGLRVPEDVSIIGFDDLEIAGYLNPPLTTIRVPATQLGERAAEMIVARVSENTELQSIELQTELVVRGSTGAPSNKAR